ncbi:MAG TPA: protein tyrosine phosphatase family protein [Terriglobales bacterium]|nr:protein tyrosine phosphatase family protein [Terriglobales bacterium]
MKQDSLMQFWRSHILVITVFALTLCAGSHVPQMASPGASSRSFAHRLTIKGVPNAGDVTPELYRGGQPTEQGFEALARLGINIVVDLRGSRESERERVNNLGMQYVAIPWHCPFPHDDVFARFLSLLRQNPGKKVFVHCRLGDDRAGMTIAAYRMAEQGWTAQEAMKEMEAYGFSSSHHFICPSLSSYEASFPRRFSASPAFRSLHGPAPSTTQ